MISRTLKNKCYVVSYVGHVGLLLSLVPVARALPLGLIWRFTSSPSLVLNFFGVSMAANAIS